MVGMIKARVYLFDPKEKTIESFEKKDVVVVQEISELIWKDALKESRLSFNISWESFNCIIVTFPEQHILSTALEKYIVKLQNTCTDVYFEGNAIVNKKYEVMFDHFCFF